MRLIGSYYFFLIYARVRVEKLQFLFQLVHKAVNSLHLGGDVNTLRAMRDTMVTADTVVRLTKPRNRAVIAHEERPAIAFELVLGVIGSRHRSLGDALVVVRKNTRYVQAVRARHTVVASGTRNRFEFVYILGER